ncbi:YbhB/YbcL family Raf kinase inhibitor-like protein [Bisgaard Taxon 10/6]|uniref:YbhB/YbcL family Raf kinase inhibitor-like protein n=1 Tax=Exercitatus varius TaxID=67857 RepID=A0AAW6QDY6_9PAST|nr:YbhB/YbcL family Raf kinase inhibitor-like protein [Exercitatus varius]MDG2914959.1 YbhB/YbcL family Raf kinase inhibitor-like protein [Exercitatus varius]MDG2916659.1 YbhB/YbcL family Raf kinase inhibitor-like protein [Exercitatus varius]MDG2950405.1 YbhB/YbcL family Raf kinase inhibitor-like protein [Exercitatus varius]MDG2951353.1 YbhB/YbcL family Raf kinase inhibitor-like protein [Exercitatus varius]
MKVTSSAIVKGAFEDKYGKRGNQFTPNGMPSYSVPFEITDAPEGTKSFVVVMEDKDAITASGFVWIHWLIANLHRTSVSENESQTATDFIQGANSWASKLGGFSIEEASAYGGMAPPNCLHRYEIIVYALDSDLDLAQGFRFNDLHFAMQGHILAQAVVMGTYDV